MLYELCASLRRFQNTASDVIITPAPRLVDELWTAARLVNASHFSCCVVCYSSFLSPVNCKSEKFSGGFLTEIRRHHEARAVRIVELVFVLILNITGNKIPAFCRVFCAIVRMQLSKKRLPPSPCQRF